MAGGYYPPPIPGQEFRPPYPGAMMAYPIGPPVPIDVKTWNENQSNDAQSPKSPEPKQ